MAFSASVLVVEDDPNDRELLEAALRDAGWMEPIQFFGNGVELIDHLRRSTTQGDRGDRTTRRLLFLDLNIPQIDGCGVVAWVRKQFSSPAIRIVVLSGSGDSFAMKTAAALGADRLLVKPPPEAALREELAHLLAQAANR